MSISRHMKCRGCGKSPEQIDEYVEYGRLAKLSPSEYVRQEEGTYNPDTGLFYCTDCYINLGMPEGTA